MAEREDAAWRFSVADNGLGIEPQHVERIFDPFQRLHPGDAFPGNGIGLAICKRIVELHAGSIWAEAVPGGGSIFHFTIADQRDETNVALT
jgi:signal transduction histidine kinase